MDWGDIYNVDQYGCNRHDGNDVYEQCDFAGQYCPGLKQKVDVWMNETGKAIAEYGHTDWDGGTPSHDMQQLQVKVTAC